MGQIPGFFPCLPEMHLDHGKYLDLYIASPNGRTWTIIQFIPSTFPLFHYLPKILFKCGCISLFILGTIGIIVIIRKPECFILICLWHRFHCLYCLTVWSTGCFLLPHCQKVFPSKRQVSKAARKSFLFFNILNSSFLSSVYNSVIYRIFLPHKKTTVSF